MKKILLSSAAVVLCNLWLSAQCSFSGLNTTYSSCDPQVALTGNPAGGGFSGPGVSGNNFNPAVAGIGTHTISYFGAYLVNQVGSYAPLTQSSPNFVTLSDDQLSGALPIGFSFLFYGNTYTSFYLSSNGFISFDAGAGSGCCTGQALPNATVPNNVIACAWEDLYPPAGGSISYSTIGTAPNRILVVQYSNIQHFSSGNPVTSQILLYESSNIIEIHTASMPSDGGSHTMGIENASGTLATVVPGRNSTSWSVTNDYVQFTPCSSTQTVTVTQDQVAPTFNCLPDITTTTDAGVCSALVSYTLPTCGTSSQTVFSQPGNNMQDGRISNNLWPLVCAEDFSLSGGCSAISVVTAPFFTIAPDGSGASSFTINFYSNNAGTPGAILSSQVVLPGAWSTAYVGTNYGLFINNFTFTLPSPVNLCTGSYFISVQANITGNVSDFYWEFSTNAAYGNNGLNAPNASGPWTVQGDNFVFTLTAAGQTGDLTDNCDVCPTLTQTAGLPSGSNFPVGTTVNTFVASDGSGNTTICSFNVVVTEAVAPIPNTATLNDVISSCAITSLIPPTASDACSGTVIGTSSAILPITSNTTITWVYTDANGNQSTQNQNIIVQDIIAPTPDLSNLPEVIEQCELLSLQHPTATDNCNGTINGFPNVSFPLNQSTIITWTYTDNSGNTSTQQQIVTIDDNTAPVPDLAVLPVVSGSCSIDVLENPTATDNCSNITVSNDAILPFTIGTYVVNWTYTDESGNQSIQSQNIVVEDNDAPVPNILSLPEIVALCELNNLNIPTALDACEGTISATTNSVLPITQTTTVIWTYTDGFGNSSSQNQLITINTPAVDVLQNVATLTCQNNNSGVTYQWINCDNNSPVAGATGQSFTPTSSGSYAVIVTENSCSDTSDCYSVDYTDLDEENKFEFSIYPNPNDGIFTVKSDIDGVLYIYDITGKALLETNISKGLNDLFLDFIADGMYEIRVESEDYSVVVPLVVHH